MTFWRSILKKHRVPAGTEALDTARLAWPPPAPALLQGGRGGGFRAMRERQRKHHRHISWAEASARMDKLWNMRPLMHENRFGTIAGHIVRTEAAGGGQINITPGTGGATTDGGANRPGGPQ